MSASKLVFEIGTEEIPAMPLYAATRDLAAAAETAHIPHVPAAGIGFAPGVGAAARHCVAALGVARADTAGFRVVGMC